MLMCVCVCKYAWVCMHVQVSTATSLAWSHEVNPGGFHQFRLGEGCLGRTSGVYVDAPAPEAEALQADVKVHVKVPARWEVGG